MQPGGDQVKDGMNGFHGNGPRTPTAELALGHDDGKTTAWTLDNLNLIPLFR